MRYPRSLTRIHQIEISSRCNLACVYCPHPKMLREKVDMSWETFIRCLEWITHFTYTKGGTQTEVSLTGIGEALLHPLFPKMLGTIRELFPTMRLLLATNGLAVTAELAKVIASNQCEVFVSLHRPEAAGPAIELLKKYGVAVGINTSFATSALDWAGTVKHFVSAPKTVCQYLAQGWGTVLSDGRITTCCMDSEGLGIVGHVNDQVGAAYFRPYSLCSTCHLTVP